MVERGAAPVPAKGGEQGPSRGAKVGAGLGVLFSVAYLINPVGTFVEFIPDIVPFIGNLDEAGITGLLIYCLRILGVEVLPGRRTGDS